MHLIADQPPSLKALTALNELQAAVLTQMMLAELEIGRWEDDGGSPGPPEQLRLMAVLGRLVRGRGAAE